jgi:hypothetical protein
VKKNLISLLLVTSLFYQGTNQASAAPSNTVLPSISGEVSVGGTLIINTGSWNTVSTTFNIQWFTCSSSIATSCSAIAGRTTSSYVITSADLTKYLRASVTALDATGGATVFTSLVGPVVSTPQVSVLPVISGIATPGSVLTATRGAWSGAALSGDQYQWLRCSSLDTSNCTVISTGVINTYTVQNLDTGFRIGVNVTVKDVSNKVSGSAKSLTTQAVLGSPTVSTVPKFTSNLYVGGLATLDRGTWSTAGNTNYIYQWQRCSSQIITACVNITGATAATYLVTSSELNQFLRVAITAINEVGGSTVYSGFSEPIAATAPPVNTSAPLVSGSPFETSTMTLISKGQWSGVVETQLLTQWQICTNAISCVDISTATSTTYVATSSDVGKSIRVKITAPYSQKNVEAFSNQTSLIKKAHTNVFEPTLLSYADIGDTIDIFQGAWEGLLITKLSYIWQRCSSLSSCKNITGATSNTYKPTTSDRGYSLRVGESPSAGTAYAYSELSNQIPALVVAKKTITCIKGKTTKKVTATNPKCPTGYKKK